MTSVLSALKTPVSVLCASSKGRIMKIQVMSDIHREFGVPDLDFHNDADILIVAGDISVSGETERELNNLGFPSKKKVLAVKGNHDRWVNPNNPSFPVILDKNITILDRQIKTIKKQRFLGCSLWYDPDKTDGNWSDFVYYNREKIEQHHKDDVRFIYDNLKEGDVVITHFLPSYSCIAPRWKKFDSNCYFVGEELEELIKERKPKLWIFGHTHDSIDFHIGETRMICNPYGYYGHQLNPNYEVKIIDI